MVPCPSCAGFGNKPARGKASCAENKRFFSFTLSNPTFTNRIPIRRWGAPPLVGEIHHCGLDSADLFFSNTLFFPSDANPSPVRKMQFLGTMLVRNPEKNCPFVILLPLLFLPPFPPVSFFFESCALCHFAGQRRAKKKKNRKFPQSQEEEAFLMMPSPSNFQALPGSFEGRGLKI